MKNRKIKVGFDFDGVIAYNPFRIVRPVMAYIKKNLFGVKKLKFWYPKYHWQQIFWTICHESSVFPAKGVDQLIKLVNKGEIEAHLVTARYSFLDNHLFDWLQKYKLKKYFKTITLNNHNEQPHLFKEKLIEKYQLDIFIEDNLDIVKYLNGKHITYSIKHKTKKRENKTKIFWIYNILDRNNPYPHKFPYLEKAMEEIIKGKS